MTEDKVFEVDDDKHIEKQADEIQEEAVASEKAEQKKEKPDVVIEKQDLREKG